MQRLLEQRHRFVLLDIDGYFETYSSEQPVELEFWFAWQGEGEERHPLGFIDSTSLDQGGDFSVSLLYPAAEGEGLLVFGWLDLEPDGEFCAPGTGEASDLVEIEAPLVSEIHISMQPRFYCAGPEALWPSAPEALP